MRIWILLLFLCTTAVAQFERPLFRPHGDRFAERRSPLPTVQTVAGDLDVHTAKGLPANVWLRFTRMPAVRELAALKHSRIRGTLVFDLKAAPTAADCARLSHGPRGWRMVLAVPLGSDLRALHHVRAPLEVLIPGATVAQTETLVKPYRNARRAEVSERVCRHVIR